MDKIRDTKSTQKTLYWIILGLVMLIATYARWQRINMHSFFIDELWHVLSARSFIENGAFALPSGWLYNRAYPFTYLVSLSFRLFGVSEMSARLPGIMFGVLVIPAAYLVFSRLLSRSAALITALILALSPLDIMLSSFCRMYTLFQLLFLLVVYYFYRALEDDRGTVPEQRFLWRTRVVTVLILAGLFWFTLKIQQLAMLFVAPAVAYCALMSADRLIRGKWKGFIRSKYTWVVLGAIAAGGLYLIIKGAGMLAMPSTPVWALKRDVNYYRWFLESKYPVFYYLLPVAVLYLIMRRPKIGLYLTCCFALPFFIISYIIPWRALRYLHFIFPYFIVINAFLIEAGIRFIWLLGRKFQETHFSLPMPVVLSKAVSVLLGGTVALVAGHTVLLPWARTPPEKAADIPMYNITSLVPALDAIGDKDILIITEPHIVEYYSSRTPDYILFSTHSSDEGGQVEMVKDSEGNPVHLRSGTRFVMDLAELKSIEAGSERVWIFTSDYYVKSPPLAPDIVAHLLNNYEKIEEEVAHYDLYVSRKR